MTRSPNRQSADAHRRDTPKDKRRKPPVVARPMADARKTLGHVARGRRSR